MKRHALRTFAVGTLMLLANEHCGADERYLDVHG
jgi:hypothetical protein